MPFAQQAHPTRMVARLSERARSSPTRISSNAGAHENPLSDSDHTPSETRDLSNQVSLVLEPKATNINSANWLLNSTAFACCKPVAWPSLPVVQLTFCWAFRRHTFHLANMLQAHWPFLDSSRTARWPSHLIIWAVGSSVEVEASERKNNKQLHAGTHPAVAAATSGRMSSWPMRGTFSATTLASLGCCQVVAPTVREPPEPNAESWPKPPQRRFLGRSTLHHTIGDGL